MSSAVHDTDLFHTRRILKETVPSFHNLYHYLISKRLSVHSLSHDSKCYKPRDPLVKCALFLYIFCKEGEI